MDQSEQAKLVTSEKKTYTGTALRLLKFLGAGCTQVEAARAAGCVEGYVSQLMKEPSFREQVNEIVTQAMKDQSKIDQNYNEIERTISERLLKLTDNVWSVDQAMRLAKFANEAKRKVAPKVSENPSGHNGQPMQPVVLILPATMIPEFVLNPNNEVVGLNGMELTTLPSSNITKLAEKHTEQLKAFPRKVIKSGPGQTDPYADL